MNEEKTTVVVKEEEKVPIFVLVLPTIEKEFSEEDADNNVVQVFDAIAEK